MGRPRKTRANKIINGTFRKDRNPTQEPEYSPIDDPLKPPASLNKYGKEYWRRITPLLQESGVLTVADLDAVYLLADAWGEYKQATYDIYHDEKTGRKRTMALYRKSREYNRRKMPEVIDRREAYELYLKLIREFGLTPVSRNRIDLAPKKEAVDPVEKMFMENNG